MSARPQVRPTGIGKSRKLTDYLRSLFIWNRFHNKVISYKCQNLIFFWPFDIFIKVNVTKFIFTLSLLRNFLHNCPCLGLKTILQNKSISSHLLSLQCAKLCVRFYVYVYVGGWFFCVKFLGKIAFLFVCVLCLHKTRKNNCIVGY